MGDHGPATLSEETCGKSPALVSQFLQGLIVSQVLLKDGRKPIGSNFSQTLPLRKYGVYRMATKTSNGKINKTSRGMRKHVRRLKQESRKAGVPINELKKKVRTPKVPKAKKEA